MITTIWIPKYKDPPLKEIAANWRGGGQAGRENSLPGGRVSVPGRDVDPGGSS